MSRSFVGNSRNTVIKKVGVFLTGEIAYKRRASTRMRAFSRLCWFGEGVNSPFRRQRWQDCYGLTFPRMPLKHCVILLLHGQIFSLDGQKPLFFTDFGGWCDRKEIYRLVIYYKEKAGITKPGGAHVLFRHTPAFLMNQNGCDLLTIQQVMRHNDIQTTMCYLHLADNTRRYK